jgi:hypothetical protein
MSEQELVYRVKDLHLISIGCLGCGHVTTIDFDNKELLEGSVPGRCSMCGKGLGIDMQALKGYRWFYDEVVKCDQVEFRVRGGQSEVAALVSEVQETISTAVVQAQLVVTTEIKQAVDTAFAREHAISSKLVDI